MGSRAIEDLGPKPRRRCVERIAARHTKGDGMIPWNQRHLIDAAIVGAFGFCEVAFLETRAGMIGSVDFDRKTFVEPRLKLRIFGVDHVGHDAHRSAAIDLFEAIEDRSQVTLVPGRVSHVVYGENNHRVDSWLTNPLRCDELREVLIDVIGIESVIEVSESIGLGSRRSERTMDRRFVLRRSDVRQKAKPEYDANNSK